MVVRSAITQLKKAHTQIERCCPEKPEELTNEDDIKTTIKLFTNNYRAVSEVHLKLTKLQKAVGFAQTTTRKQFSK